MVLLLLLLAGSTVSAAAADSAPAITTQPSGQSVAVGHTATFIVAANGSPTPSYQWQISTDYGTTWNNLSNTPPYSGATTATLTVSPVTTGLSGTQYRAIATNTAGTATSNAARLMTSLLYVLSDTEVTPSQTAQSEVAKVITVNPATGHQLSTISLGTSSSQFIRGLAVGAHGSRGYASDGATVFVFDLQTNAVTSHFSAGSKPGRLALSPDGSQLFAINTGTNAISVVDTSTETVTNTIALPNVPVEMTLSPDGARLYALARVDLASIYVVDLSSMSVTSTITTDPYPRHVVVHPDGTKLAVVCADYGDGGYNPNGPPDQTVAMIDAQTGVPIGRVTLPTVKVHPGPTIIYLTNWIGVPSFLSDGTRLYVPQWIEGWTTSPTSYIHQERLFVIDPDAFTIVSTQNVPSASSVVSLYGSGGVFVPLMSDGPQVFLVGPASTDHIEPGTGAMTPLGGGVLYGKVAVAIATPPCWFEIWPQQRYVRNTAPTMTIDVPAESGCAWTATTSASWLTIQGGSGSGPGTITLTASQTTQPRTTTVTVGSQTITISQLMSSMVIDAPADGATVTLPLDVNGWAIDRIDPPPTYSSSGVSVELWDQADPASGRSESRLATSRYSYSRPDIAALFGAAYANSGFSLRASRLAAGPHTLQVRGTSVYDNSLITRSVTVTVQRKPLLVLDEPIKGSVVNQPFLVKGWAVDETAPAGTGVDAVHVWAFPSGGGPAIFVGAASYGIERSDVEYYLSAYQAYNNSSGFLYSGFTQTVTGLPGGSYTIVAYAHCTTTGTFDATASAEITIPNSAPPFGAFDTPSTGPLLTGAVAVTGWALDDGGVDRVEIWRNCVETIDRPRGACTSATPGGPANFVFIGRAAFLPGARPDVEALYSNYPQAARAGWGYMLLTNALPHLTKGTPEGGQGTFLLYAYALDNESRQTLLGSKYITLDNDHATIPFGNLDTPEQGGTVPGPAFPYNDPAAYPVFGWAMTQAGKCIDTTKTTSYRVYIDGVQQTLTPGTNWFAGLNRSDIAAAFPGYCNSNNGLAAYYMDIRPLANGLHTIGWDVIDDQGKVAGIGSRFFIVSR